MRDPNPATTAGFSDPAENRRRRIEEERQRLSAWDAAADNPANAAAIAALNEHYHSEHHDAEDDDSIEVCCVAAMLEAAGFVDTFEAYERGRAEGRAAERRRIVAAARDEADEFDAEHGGASFAASALRRFADHRDGEPAS